jgi:hypothetical protein
MLSRDRRVVPVEYERWLRSATTSVVVERDDIGG